MEPTDTSTVAAVIATSLRRWVGFRRAGLADDRGAAEVVVISAGSSVRARVLSSSAIVVNPFDSRAYVYELGHG